MNIKDFSHNLQKLYSEMSESFSSYQSTSGWNCLSGCGRCCANPEIEASMLEMLPLALKIYDEGKALEWLEKIENSQQETCLLFEAGATPGLGRCSEYQNRPSLCRMFGVAGYLNKKKEVTLSICRYIREEYKVTEIPTGLDPEKTPILAHWSYKMSALDPKLLQERMPINKALQKALEKVLFLNQLQQYSDLVK